MDVDTISANDLKGYIEILLEQNADLAIEVDLLGAYLLTLNKNVTATKKAMLEALYYITTTSYEIRLFLDSMLSASERGKYTNLYKYLAIQLYENTDKIPMMVNRIHRQVGSEMNIQKIKAASKKFSKDLAGQIKLLDLEDLLSEIRNVAAHNLLDKEKIFHTYSK